MNHEKTEILDIIPPENTNKKGNTRREKNEKIITILAIAITVLIIAIVGIIGYNQFTNKPESNNKVSNISEEDKKSLADKTRIMLVSLYDYEEIYKSGDYSVNYDFWDVNTEVLLYNKLTDIQKLIIVLKYALESESPHCIETACSEVTKEDVEKIYYNLFNEQPIHQSINYFPQVEYSEKDSLYYLSYYNEIEHEPVRFLTYINRFEQEDNLYNVYVNVGLNSMREYQNIYDAQVYNNGEDHQPEFKRLLEVDQEKDVYFKNIDINSGEFYITKDNYERFSEYKLTFEKTSSGNLVYKSSAKTK